MNSVGGMNEKFRSGCPVSLGLDIFGDRWTLLIIRDLMFSEKRHFREMLHSDERISSNILADRLNMLVLEGIVGKTEDPSHLQKVIYSLTEKGIALLPILLEISRWSYQYRPVGVEFLPTDATLEPETFATLISELRKTHLVEPKPAT
jgi:DNA-binding HxlR family transcriptional regulator